MSYVFQLSCGEVIAVGVRNQKMLKRRVIQTVSLYVMQAIRWKIYLQPTIDIYRRTSSDIFPAILASLLTYVTSAEQTW
ncbi:MAG: hypothetical protein ACYC1M_18060 [Armatimonadota bacterium]